MATVTELEQKFLARLAELEAPYPSIDDLRYRVFALIESGDITLGDPSPEEIEEAVQTYLAANPPVGTGTVTSVNGEEPVEGNVTIDVSGSVASVNGEEPDESGNITIDVGVLTVNGNEPDEAGNIVVSTGGTGGVSDHGALEGLSDDDHTQYHNDARGDARYYVKSQVDSAVNTRLEKTDVTVKRCIPYDYDNDEFPAIRDPNWPPGVEYTATLTENPTLPTDGVDGDIILKKRPAETP